MCTAAAFSRFQHYADQARVMGKNRDSEISSTAEIYASVVIGDALRYLKHPHGAGRFDKGLTRGTHIF